LGSPCPGSHQERDRDPASPVFLIADAVLASKAGHKTPDGYDDLERMLKRVVASKGQILLCGTCMDACGLTDAEMMAGARRSSMAELADRHARD
jgi:uncharacterized protein involved in oxidation of intracellular sulfur